MIKLDSRKLSAISFGFCERAFSY